MIRLNFSLIKVFFSRSLKDTSPSENSARASSSFEVIFLQQARYSVLSFLTSRSASKSDRIFCNIDLLDLDKTLSVKQFR